MENAINTLRIQNFKSIKDVTLQPRRVNLIIGPPNVGKSNILEAMSLLGSIVYEQTDKFMGSFIRYEEPRQLFYDNLVANNIKVFTNFEKCEIGLRKKDEKFVFVLKKHPKRSVVVSTKFYGGGTSVPLSEFLEESTVFKSGEFIHSQDYLSSLELEKSKGAVYTEFNASGVYGVKNENRTYDAPKNYPNNVNIRSYVFDKNTQYSEEYSYLFLQPRNGSNLINIIQAHASFRKEVARMFEPYGLKLLLRVDERRLEVIKDLDGVIYSYPYSSIADTLQRIIFYLAAIESNNDAVILFEEPEAHSYPQYVSMLGQRIVESQNNQFFVATHSPYLVTEILEQMTRNDTLDTELAIFVAYYEDYQTKVRQLTNEEVRTIRNDAVDVFINMDRFTPAAPDA